MALVPLRVSQKPSKRIRINHHIQRHVQLFNQPQMIEQWRSKRKTSKKFLQSESKNNLFVKLTIVRQRSSPQSLVFRDKGSRRLWNKTKIGTTSRNMALDSLAIRVNMIILVTSARADMWKVILVPLQEEKMRKTRLLSQSTGLFSNP